MIPKLKLKLPISLLILGLLAGVFLFIAWYDSGKTTKTVPEGIPAIEEFRTLNYQQQLDLVKIFGSADPIGAWAYVKSAFFVNGQQTVNAHEFAHLVGNAMYTKYGLDGITNCDDTFAFGCYHGASQKLLEEKGTSVIREIQDRCIQIFPPDKSQNYAGCIHGMGHGLMTWEHFAVDKALQDCDILDKLYQDYCFDGVFMEHAMELAPGEFDPDHPWQFCTQLDSKYRYNCARYQATIFLSQFGSDISKVGAACAKVSDEILSSTCFESLGFYITEINTGKLASILEACNQLKGSSMYHCIIGASREVAFQAYVGWQETAKALCESLPKDWSAKCEASKPAGPM